MDCGHVPKGWIRPYYPDLQLTGFAEHDVMGAYWAEAPEKTKRKAAAAH